MNGTEELEDLVGAALINISRHLLCARVRHFCTQQEWSFGIINGIGCALK